MLCETVCAVIVICIGEKQEWGAAVCQKIRVSKYAEFIYLFCRNKLIMNKSGKLIAEGIAINTIAHLDFSICKK